MIATIREARERLAPLLSPTPLVSAAPLSGLAGRSVFLKLENLQPTGSFKVRPAFNGMLARLEQARESGVVTSSSGNFAQAVAYAGRELGVDTAIVMMRSASPYKRARTEAYGGRVVECDNTFEARWETTFRLERETNRLLLHPYDSDETIAGDATLGLELLEQIDEPFTVLVPISGGGLIGGVAAAVKEARPACRVIGVQARANPSMQRSLAAGERIAVEPGPSLADALVVAKPGERPFELARRYVDDVVLVDEDEIAAAVGLLAVEHKLVIEGGGAVGVAALAAGRVSSSGPVVCVLSGGNILPEKLSKTIAEFVVAQD